MEIFTGKPYRQIKIGPIILRCFSSKVSDVELVWHQDARDRICIPLCNLGKWHFQFDNDLPFEMKRKVFIPKFTYHRLIRNGAFPLIVLIVEYTDE